ncbi:DUF6778 family protein [uncultured Tateyamaria sp.]|uniref:DUF6778 family protein n=1 Tax=uncultured Tateyamaria sp. TaxID=455651 RepID=UPI00260FADEC|nr:DUF6778 family protein [uncultured Tateyamaria sp.]
MKRMKLVLLLAMGGLVSACANTNVASRNVPFEAPALPFAQSAPVEATSLVAPLTDVRVDSVTVRVPRALSVSEANRYLPKADIVWRGDAIGDRHAQVAAIFDTAMRRGTDPLSGTVPVALDVKVLRFHALSEKARYTVGGVHNINFELTLRNPKTGALLTEPRLVRADLDGFGGQQALQAEARGLTQKVRITNHLAEVIRQELTTVEGYKNPQLGFIQAMNQI